MLDRELQHRNKNSVKGSSGNCRPENYNSSPEMNSFNVFTWLDPGKESISEFEDRKIEIISYVEQKEN